MSQTKAQLIGAVGVSTVRDLSVYGGVNATGIVTATSFYGGSATITGNVSIAGTLTYEDVTNVDSVGLITARSGVNVTGGTVVVGSGVTLSSSGINVVGIVTATDVSVASSITAATFYGNGSGLTGAGSTVADDTTTDANFYPVFTQTTSGTITASKVSTSKLNFNPSVGILNATLLRSSNSSGSEGGEIRLAQPASGTTLSGEIIIDSYGDLVRIFELGGTNRGATLNISNQGSQSAIITSSATQDANITIRNTSPTVVFRDTDANTGYIHVNNSLMYVLRGANDSADGAWSQVSGQWPFIFNLANNDGTCGGNFAAVGNVTAYSSDRRLKENFNYIKSPLEKVLKLNGYTFDWKEEVKELGFTPELEKNDIGLIAQEVQEVLPQAVVPAPFDQEWDNDNDKYVSKSGENYLTVQYERLVPLLVEAIKEQQEQIKNQQEQINELRALLEDK